MSPEDTGEFGRYCEYRLRGEDELCTRLRMRLGENEARQFEAELRAAEAGVTERRAA